MENVNELKKQIFDAVETICKDYEEKHKPEFKPEFKVGQWAGFKTSGGIYPFLIHHFEGDKVYGQVFKSWHNIYDIVWHCHKNNLISVTKEEIEAHLKEICDKYIGKRILVQTFDDGTSDIVKEFLSYEPEGDTMRYLGEGNYTIYPYDQGKFAEIIPDKKKLPKTREEFKEFLCGYYVSDAYTSNANMEEFLDQYEIE